MQTFKLFVSSPGDVMVERRRVENVVSRLNGEFAGVARLEAIRWETEFYQAYSTFQAQIPRSTECDLVIGILKWRLGTELPPDFGEKLPDGQPFPSGTAYEILTAISKRQKGVELPDIYVFRFAGSSPSVAVEDPNRARIEHDWQVLKGFFQEWFLTDRGHFKAAFNPYRSEDDFEAQLERLLRKWVADKVAGGRAVRWPIEVKGSPFRGLAAFGAKHAPVFFGRNRDTARAVDLWREAGARGCAYLLAVGASGSGKSSLVRAGVVPRLTTAGVIKEVDAWRIAVMRPSDSPAGPFAALAAALMQNEAGLPKDEEGRGPALPEIEQGDSRTPAELACVLRHADAAAVKPIVNALSRVAAGEHDRERYRRDVRCDLVLLIDQLEELFAASVDPQERTGFIDLVAALAGTGRVWVAATLRADFYARMLNQPALKKLKELGATYDLAPPGPAELGEIVRAPAEAAGLVYETDPATGERLDARLLRDADRPDMLPLVQLALSRLFEGRERVGDETRLRLQVYESLGGLKGIINEAGEAALAALGDTEKARLPRLLRQLAVPAHDQGGGGALTVRAVPLTQAAPDAAAHRLLDALVTARLITISGKEADAQARLAHQRVLEDWSRARAIVTESADFYRIRADLEESRSKWETGNRRSELLLARGLPLAEAESIAGKYGDELAPEMRAYVLASRQRANRAQMIGWAVAATFALLAVGTAVAAKLAHDQSVAAKTARQDAEHQRDHALENGSRFLASRAMEALAASDATSAALISLAGLPDAAAGVERPYAPPAEAALFAASLRVQETAVLAGHDDAVQGAAFSPDGKRVVTASSDKTARIWDTATHRQVAILVGHDKEVSSAAFSPDGKRVVTASGDNTARIWDAETGRQIAVLAGHENSVLSAAFSPDGRNVVTASWDKTTRLWDAATYQQIAVLAGPDLAGLEGINKEVNRATFSPDGRRVVTALQDKTAVIWDVATRQQLAVLAGHDQEVESAAFSPDGRRVVTASSDETARIWDAETHQQIAVLAGHDASLTSAAFSPDGRRVVTASFDKTLRIWNAETGQQIAVLARYDGGALSAEFSPDGRYIVTAVNDHTARIWDTEVPPHVAVLAGDDDAVVSAAFSPDGRRLITASADRTARVWDAATHRQIAVLEGQRYGLTGAAFSPDGRRIAISSWDKTAQILDAETYQHIAVLIGHEKEVNSAAFSPDGKRVVTASSDGTARIWDAESGRQIALLSGHGGAVESAAFSPDGRRVVTASLDMTARLWDAETARQIAVLAGHEKEVNSAAFSPDGRRVVTASWDNTARIWDAETHQQIAVLGHDDGVESAAFSPDGRRVVTAGVDGTARIWDARTRQQIAVLAGHDKLVLSAAFSPDGRHVATTSFDNTARIWDVFPTTQDIIDYSKQIVSRCLTGAELERAFLDPEPPAWCIQMEKWPYGTQDWKDWLRFEQSNAGPPLPDAPEWAAWRAAHR